MSIEEMQDAWQNRPAEIPSPSMEQVRRKARRFRAERLLATISAAPFFLAFSALFLAGAIFGEILACRLGCLLATGALTDSFWRLLRSDWGWEPATTSVVAFRSHLERRRDQLCEFPLRTGLPLAMAATMIAAGWAWAEPQRWGDAMNVLLFGLGFPVAVWVGNAAVIARLKRDIDRLNAAQA